MVQNSVNSGNAIVQMVSTSLKTLLTTGTGTPYNNSIPQQSQGTQVLSLSITPKYSTSKLEIRFYSTGGKGIVGAVTAAIYQDSNANALSAKGFNALPALSCCFDMQHVMTSGTTSPTTFKAFVSSSENTYDVNGRESGTQTFGGVSSTVMIVTEYL